ncbi:dipeptidyl-peptidase 7, partial [Pseudoalteromonas sp. S4389]|uniref:S46 family peptidase n=1 Tax=Pseudoalteromonas sp. S4389 TaxID=579556 RepID=UPI00110912AF
GESNLHCSYGSNQYNSPTENTILEYGFLAKTTSVEVPAAPGCRGYVTEQVTEVPATVTHGTGPLAGMPRCDSVQAIDNALSRECDV